MSGVHAIQVPYPYSYFSNLSLKLLRTGSVFQSDCYHPLTDIVSIMTLAPLYLFVCLVFLSMGYLAHWAGWFSTGHTDTALCKSLKFIAMSLFGVGV